MSDSKELKSLLAQHGPLHPARAVDVVRQVAATIDDAHATKTVHRAVATGTILLAADGSVYLADIGGSTPSTDRTRTLITDPEATYRSDIYALTSVFYECLTGQPPDTSATVTPPSRQRPGIPAEFDVVVARGLAAKPEDRYRSAGELAAAAQRALTPAHVPPVPPSAAGTRTFALPQRQSPPFPVNSPPPQWNPPPAQPPPAPSLHAHPGRPPVPQRRRRRIGPAIAVVVIVGTVVAGAITIPRFVRRGGEAAPATSAALPRRTFTAQPIKLPFPAMYPTKSIAVDGAGNLYVLASVVPPPDAGPLDTTPAKLWKLAPGAAGAVSIEIPGVNFRFASDLAVDKAGNVYYCDGAGVYVLEVGKSLPIRLPFRGFSTIATVAVDDAGNTYAAGAIMGDGLDVKYGAKKLAPGENKPTDLSFGTVYLPRGIAVDKTGNVYMSTNIKGTGRGQVLKLPLGANAPTPLSIPGVIEPNHIAFDNAGDVFVGDGFGKGFFQLPPSGSPVEVPLGIHTSGVAVDSAGAVYVLTSARSDNTDKIVQPGQVLKIAPDR